ncbi:unnamed protein product [Spodoptera littoralis]|uniref:Uncharacterized protein n=1 Tax=Spodoptera littoralis TaxID=7109 RepID=A0A9P0MZM0_SPOLI|nr:unnamed protein product [Spodoptera littoralis]CAH1636006.1 unnamed protein product [Spodoptera littoralis]
MLLFVLLVFTSVDLTQQHLVYPINYCSLASVCVHDNRMVCAATEDGCGRKTFLDQCDMYEYNCDFGARCEEVEVDEKNTTSDENITKAPVENNTPSENKTDETPARPTSGRTKSINEIPRNDELCETNPNLKNNCVRPKTWLTTVKGETRDFFRILITSTPK